MKITLTENIAKPLRKIHIPVKSGYNNANNVMKVETDTLDLYKKSQGLLTRFQNTFDTFTQGPQFDYFRGQLNAMADQAGLRMTVDFMPKNPDKLLVTVFDKQYLPDSEFFTEIVNAFKEPKKFFSHLKNFSDKWADSYSISGTDFRRRVVVDPKKEYVSKVKNAIYELVESREIEKHRPRIEDFQ